MTDKPVPKEGERRFDYNLRWHQWQLTQGFVWLAETWTSLSPVNVAQVFVPDPVSTVLRQGTRTWMFKEKADRDRFVQTYQDFNAIAIGESNERPDHS